MASAQNTLATLNCVGNRLSQIFAPSNYNEIVMYLRSNDYEITYDTIRRYLTNERRPDFEFLIKVSALKNVSVDWLLTGQPEKYWKAESREELWRHYLPNEIQALKTYSQKMGLSLSAATHRLVVDGLFGFGLLNNPHPLNFYQQKSGAKEIPIQVWGEIGYGESFAEIKPHDVAYVPAEVEPKKLRDESELRAKPIYHICFHAYRVKTDEYEKIGVPNGSLIVCGNRNSFGYQGEAQDEPVLLQAGAGTKLLLRRYFFDYQNRAGYVYMSMTGRSQIERFADVNATHMQTIHGVVI